MCKYHILPFLISLIEPLSRMFGEKCSFLFLKSLREHTKTCKINQLFLHITTSTQLCAFRRVIFFLKLVPFFYTRALYNLFYSDFCVSFDHKISFNPPWRISPPPEIYQPSPFYEQFPLWVIIFQKCLWSTIYSKYVQFFTRRLGS